jgi:hypothetical protein
LTTHHTKPDPKIDAGDASSLKKRLSTKTKKAEGYGQLSLRRAGLYGGGIETFDGVSDSVFSRLPRIARGNPP